MYYTLSDNAVGYNTKKTQVSTASDHRLFLTKTGILENFAHVKITIFGPGSVTEVIETEILVPFHETELKHDYG